MSDAYRVPECPKCRQSNFTHEHDTAHGLDGTHMNGSERFTCEMCGHRVYASEGKVLGFAFVLD